MHLRERNHPSSHIFTGTILLVAISLGCSLDSVSAAGNEAAPAGTGNPPAHMSETLRSSIHDLAVVPGADPTSHDIAGSYDEEKPSVSSGIASGTTLGTPSMDVGPVTVGTSIPALILPGAIVGGLYGHAKGKVQGFRDALTEDLASATNQPLTNSRLALLVYQELQGLPDLESNLFAATTPIADDTDAILYVSINNVVIDVRDDEAILKTTAEITMLSKSDGTRLYRKWFYYQDMDTLSNWTENDNALWHDYANFAGHYLGREIAADVFARVTPRHELRPAATESMSLKRNNEWQGSSKFKAPELAWDLTLLGDDPHYSWVDKIDESNIYYDLEIYDTHRLVYAKEQIPEPYYELDRNLDTCVSYRWSIRPSYHVGDSIKYGEWMRSPSKIEQDTGKGHIGQKASKAPAYIQDFPYLKIDCRAR